MTASARNRAPPAETRRSGKNGSFGGFRLWIAEGIRQRGRALPGHVQIGIVLGYSIEQGQEAFQRDQPVSIVSRLDLQERLIYSKTVEARTPLEVAMKHLRLRHPLEPIGQRFRVLIERVVELHF